jgi:ribosomal protein S18 acetylase RimI-like enzyme
MVVERVSAVTAELVAALAQLVPQLNGSNSPPTVAELALLLKSSANALVIARHTDDTGPIIGAGALGLYRVPTGIRAVIEDVVVDSSHRGMGIGEAITRELMDLARKAGARGVSLTSNPGRRAANRLYVRLGFALRQTNCYYFEFP